MRQASSLAEALLSRSLGEKERRYNISREAEI